MCKNTHVRASDACIKVVLEVPVNKSRSCSRRLDQGTRWSGNEFDGGRIIPKMYDST